MASGVNKVILIGNLGKDPEVRYTPSGQAVANFNIAITESWNDKQGQRQERTEWVRIVVWGKTAELCGEYLAKGRQVYLEGKLQTRSYDDREGKKVYITEVVANTVQFIGSRGDAQGVGGQSGGMRRQAGGQEQGGAQGGSGQDMNYDYGPPPGDDDVPF